MSETRRGEPVLRGPLARVAAAPSWTRWAVVLGLVVIVSAVRVATGADDVTSAATIRAALVAACPILLAGMGGLWSERAGVVNIGLEGQILLGTWGAAYFTYWYGPWTGVIGAAAMGAIGGLVHGIATITFGVDHIVSGVALNIIAMGATQFLAEAFFSDYQNGGPRQLNGLDPLPYLTIPGLSDALVSLNGHHWFLISDLAGLAAALTNRLSALTLVTLVIVVASSWILWHTRFGLRLRSCGESPSAAESLGVNVYLYKYIAVLISGALAGIGGAFLCLVSSSGFVTNQANGRGYIGLAAMIFGNWRPAGTLGASLLFGYTDALRLRTPTAVHALLLLVALLLVLGALWRGYQRSRRAAGALALLAVGFAVWFAVTDTVPREFTGMTPYVATLLLLALSSQRLRMPAADGQPYKRGTVG